MRTKIIATNRSRAKEFKLIAGIVAISGFILAALAFLTPQIVGAVNEGTEILTIRAYTALNMLMALLGGFMFAAGVAYILLKEDDETHMVYHMRPVPVTPVPVPAPVATADHDAARTAESSNGTEAAAPPPAPEAVGEGEKQDGDIILRLLSGDEKAVFQLIMDAGGEMFQKEIVNSTDMSDAKVSRVLDRLAEKGIITKERQGMSNKVRIALEK